MLITWSDGGIGDFGAFVCRCSGYSTHPSMEKTEDQNSLRMRPFA